MIITVILHFLFLRTHYFVCETGENPGSIMSGNDVKSSLLQLVLSLSLSLLLILYSSSYLLLSNSAVGWKVVKHIIRSICSFYVLLVARKRFDYFLWPLPPPPPLTLVCIVFLFLSDATFPTFLSKMSVDPLMFSRLWGVWEWFFSLSFEPRWVLCSLFNLFLLIDFAGSPVWGDPPLPPKKNFIRLFLMSFSMFFFPVTFNGFSL